MNDTRGIKQTGERNVWDGLWTDFELLIVAGGFTVCFGLSGLRGENEKWGGVAIVTQADAMLRYATLSLGLGCLGAALAGLMHIDLTAFN